MEGNEGGNMKSIKILAAALVLPALLNATEHLRSDATFVAVRAPGADVRVYEWDGENLGKEITNSFEPKVLQRLELNFPILLNEIKEDPTLYRVDLLTEAEFKTKYIVEKKVFVKGAGARDYPSTRRMIDQNRNSWLNESGAAGSYERSRQLLNASSGTQVFTVKTNLAPKQEKVGMIAFVRLEVAEGDRIVATLPENFISSDSISVLAENVIQSASPETLETVDASETSNTRKASDFICEKPYRRPAAPVIIGPRLD